MDKMESDLQFIRVRMVDELSMGLFVVDTKEYKETLAGEIRAKLSQTKRILKEKFHSSIEECLTLGEKILAKMLGDPKSVKDYIQLSLYLRGEELQKDLQ